MDSTTIPCITSSRAQRIQTTAEPALFPSVMVSRVKIAEKTANSRNMARYSTR